jgi:hypothetical protein
MSKNISQPGNIAVIDTGIPQKEAKPDFTFYWFRIAELCARCIAESITYSDAQVVNSINFLIATIPEIGEQDKIYSVLDKGCTKIRAQDIDKIDKAQEIQTLYIRRGYGGCMLWADSFLGFYKTNRIGVLCKEVETISDEELIRFMKGKEEDGEFITGQ